MPTFSKSAQDRHSPSIPSLRTGLTIGAGLAVCAPTRAAASQLAGLRLTDPVVLASLGLLAAALLGTGLWYWQRRRAIARVHPALDGMELLRLDTDGFIALLQGGFHRQGFRVESLVPPGDPDDFLIRHAGGLELVRCRYWRARQVGADMVTALVQTLSRTEARRGVLVTTGQFTPEAIVAARRAGMSLLEGPRLRRLIDDLQVDWQSHRRSRRSEPAAAQLTPACPKCGSVMVARHTGIDTRPREAFWGCVRWPDCSAILLDEELEVVTIG